MKFQSNISPQNMHLIQLIRKTQNTYLIYIYIYIYTHTENRGVTLYTSSNFSYEIKHLL